ncbi:TPA: hypothetical protein ACHWOV_000689, partial [Legionella pneumophila]
EKIWIINESVSYFNECRPLLRRYAPRNDGPKNRTVQRIFLSKSRKSHFVCTELKWKNAFVSLNCYLMDIEDRI